MSARAARIRIGVVLGGLVIALALWWVLEPDATRSAGPDPRSSGPIDRTDEPLRERVRVNEPPAAEPLSDVTRVTVRDLGSGDVVPGLEFVARWAGGARTVVVSGPDGTLSLPSPPDSISIDDSDDSGWSLATRVANEAVQDGLWVHRSVKIRGTVDVDGSGAADVRKQFISIHLVFSGRKDDHRLPHEHEPPWNRDWLHAHGIERRTLLAWCDGTGAYEVEVPRIAGLGLQATCQDPEVSGWRPVWARIDEAGADQNIDLTITRSFTLSGYLRDEDGNPLPGVPIMGYVTVRGPFEQKSNLHESALIGHSVSGKFSAKTDRSIVTYGAQTSTNDDGRFDLHMNVEGDVLLTAYPRAARSVVRRLGEVEGARSGIELVAIADGSRPVRFLHRGAPVGSAVIFSDLSIGPEQPASPKRAAGKERWFDASWLEPGSTYLVLLSGDDVPDRVASGFVVWSNQREIDIATLSGPEAPPLPEYD